MANLLLVILAIWSFAVGWLVGSRKYKKAQKKFVIYQVVVTNEENRVVDNVNNNYITLENIVKTCDANSKEEAIGLFVESIKDIKVKKKIEPIGCFEII